MQALRYLALGDSYTIGESVSETERFPEQTAAKLRAAGLQVEPPLIIARTGWTTDELQEGIRVKHPPGPFDLVSLLIGVNNQYRGLPIEEYSKSFLELLKEAIDFAGKNPSRVFVLSIPDWGVTPFAEGRDRYRIAKDIDAFNAVNRGHAGKAGVHYLDITPLTRNASTDKALVAHDGLHPSGKAYGQWAELLAEQMQKTLVRV
jgi:lysophospholipase L1-like esterase